MFTKLCGMDDQSGLSLSLSLSLSKFLMPSELQRSFWFFAISIFHRQPAIEFALLVSAGIQGMLIFLHQHQVTALSVSGM